MLLRLYEPLYSQDAISSNLKTCWSFKKSLKSTQDISKTMNYNDVKEENRTAKCEPCACFFSSVFHEHSQDPPNYLDVPADTKGL